MSGTPAGLDHFYDLKMKAEEDPAWDVFEIPITATNEIALSYVEVEAMRKDMSDAEFAREMLGSFDAPVENAYYEEALNALAMQKRVTKVSVDLNTGVFTAWDLVRRIYNASGWVRWLAERFIGSITSRTEANRSVITPIFSRLRPRLGVFLIGLIFCHTTSR